jgi:transcription termination factor Rho
MSILDRAALYASPLADLHTIASELSIDGYRRLRRDDLITAILNKQDGGDGVPEAASEDLVAEAPAVPISEAETSDAETPVAETPVAEAGHDEEGAPAPTDEVAQDAVAEEPVEAEEESETPSRRRRGRRGGRGRSGRDEGEAAADGGASEPDTAEPDTAEPDTAEPEPAEPEPEPEPETAEPEAEAAPAPTPEEEPARPARPTRSRRRKAEPVAEVDDVHDVPAPAEPVAEEAPEPEGDGADEPIVEGVVELLANGSGFVRVAPPDPSDDDVYISSAQVKRCELVSGDRITGPKRAPRRSERFASLIRIETINGRPASELADSVRFDDLPAAFPDERLKIGSEDPTLKAIEWLTPFGKGSRVTIVGASRSGKTEALRRLTEALSGRDELAVSLVLSGVRPEEISAWAAGPVAPVSAVSFAASEEAQNTAIEPVIDQARRLAARGADAVVLIDSLDGATPAVARKALASARNIVGGGSVTVIATATAPLGGETTVISLDVALASIGRFPALDLTISGTIRPELLVGDAGAEAIARTRAEAAGEE